MKHRDRSLALRAVGALSEPVREALYHCVAGSEEGLSRDQAAAAVGIGRPLAAFHLDRLVRDGLLDAEYRRLGPRPGRGGGRPSKIYRRAGGEISVSLPDRDYALAGRLLAGAIAKSDGPALEQVLDQARAEGEAMVRADIGDDRDDGGTGPRRRGLRSDLMIVLEHRGFEPEIAGDGSIRLRNCPFHAMAQAEPGIVCAMNQALVDGMIGGLPGTGLSAVLDPQPGRCCVVLRRAEREPD